MFQHRLRTSCPPTVNRPKLAERAQCPWGENRSRLRDPIRFPLHQSQKLKLSEERVGYPILATQDARHTAALCRIQCDAPFHAELPQFLLNRVAARA